MKRKFAIILCALIILSSVLTLFSGCASKTAAEYKGNSIDEGIYKYWFMSLEEHYLEYYSDITDNPEFWAKEYEPGKTYGEYMDERIKTQIYCYLVAQDLFKTYGLKLSERTKQAIDDTIDEQIEYFGSKSEFNSYLSEYGINISKLKKIYTMEEKFIMVRDYLYDKDKGVEKPTDDEIDAYYRENYARIKYFMVLRNVKYVYDKDGKKVTDTNGYYKYEDLTEDEKKAQTDYANSIYEAVLGGETLDAYLKKDYPELTDVPNGYYVTAEDYHIHTPEVIEAAFDMKAGEARLVSNEDAYFIVTKFDLLDKAYNGADSAQFYYLETYVSNQKFNKKFEELIASVKFDENIIKKFSVTNDFTVVS